MQISSNLWCMMKSKIEYYAYWSGSVSFIFAPLDHFVSSNSCNYRNMLSIYMRMYD